MNITSSRIMTAAFVTVAACSSAAAAPLDAFLTANRDSTPWKGELEIGYDMTNDSLDFLHLREKNGVTTNVGDYTGAHLRGGIAITPRLWIDGAYWKRKIDYRSFVAEITTWQLAGQYKVLDGAASVPSVALRMGAWGNDADQLTKFTNTTISGTKFTSATVTQPSDVQYQLDLIATWLPSQQTEISMFAGAGKSRVSFDSIGATSRTKNGCDYNVGFNQGGSVSTLAQPCNAPIVVDRYTTLLSNTVNVDQEAKYSASYYQVGFMSAWHSTNWRLRGGYQYQIIKRNKVDDIIASRGDTAYKHNHVLVADVSYNVFKNTILFVRGQFMTNQFNGELPMAYNSLTAEKFNQRYGMVSTGLIYAF
jgi:hypothetical protein